MPSRIIAVKQIQDLSSKSNLITLQLPSNQDPCQFLIVNSTLLQLQKFSTGTNSLIVDSSICKDGSLYTATRYDPLFLLISILKSSSDQFRPLHDIIYEFGAANQASIQLVVDHTNLDTQLKHICDVKTVDGVNFFRYNQNRTLSWLHKKYELLKKILPEITCLQQHLVMLTPEEICLRLLAENIDVEHYELLKQKYDLKPKVMDMNHFEVKLADKRPIAESKKQVSKKKPKPAPQKPSKMMNYFKKITKPA